MSFGTSLGTAIASPFKWLTDVILGWFSGSGSNILAKCVEWLEFAKRMTISRWMLTAGMFGIAISVALFVGRMIAKVVASIDAMDVSDLTAQTVTLTPGDIIDFCNYYYPVNETFACASILGVLALCCHLIRSCKSWIPTVS